MKILVIEDEPRILEFLRLGLEAEGFVVDGAEDGASGLAAALAEPYRLVVLDLLLPRLTGKICSRVAAQGVDLPVLASRHARISRRSCAASTSARTTISSRSRSTRLVARVRVHVRRGRDTVGGARRPHQSLSLDLARRARAKRRRAASTSRPRVPAALPPCDPRRRDRQPGRLLSESGAIRSTRANVVDVCVRRLRKARPGLADRNGAACRLPAPHGLTGSNRLGGARRRAWGDGPLALVETIPFPSSGSA
jgi:two-component system copper resistance phosphate regulon response regulator CusR